MRKIRPRPVGANVPRSAFAGALLALGIALAACSAGDGAERADLGGSHVEVVAVWQGAEAAAFEAVLDGFEATTGATVTFTSTEGEDIAAVLDRRLADGDPPDLAVLPQPGLLARYARAGVLLPIEGVVADQVLDGWAPVWHRLATVNGELYGVWFKAANKSLIWYSLSAFEDAGLVPPDDLAGLRAVAGYFADRALPAFSITGAPSDAWTLTDWFENLYLRIAGPERYDALAEHRLPWTDPTVRATLEAMAELLQPDQLVTAAGPETTFPQSVAGVFDAEPSAAMVMEGDFVPGVVAGSSPAEVGVDVDAFVFPGMAASDRYVVGGGDAAVLMRATPASEELLRYLASTDAAAVWAGLGGFVTPNQGLGLSAYPDATTRRIARSLLEAGSGFHFDLSDLQPVEFGGTTGAGLWAELTAFVADPSDLDGTMARLEIEAFAAWTDV